MSLSARRGAATILIAAALVLVACEAETASPTPRPTWTPGANVPLGTFTPIPAGATDLPNSAPSSSTFPYPNTTALPLTQTTPQPLIPTGPQTITATVAAGAAPRVAAPIPPVAGAALFLPKFGPFPPVPIPNRPANINPLTGLAADPAMLQRRPIVARIGNEQEVRTKFWHAGLSQADIVFEELIDIVILSNAYAATRFSAVFLSQDPPLIGPIRSGRVINFQMVPMLNGALVHSGASNGTRWLFQQTPMIDLDEYFNMPAYCYIDSMRRDYMDRYSTPTPSPIVKPTTTAIPKTPETRNYRGRLATSGPRIREYLRQKGWETASPLYGFTFSDSAPGGQAITSISLTKAPWPPSEQVTWNYDGASGNYLRYQNGKPHVDTIHSVTARWGNGADCITTSKETQTQISTTNIVVLYARHEKTTIIEDPAAVSAYTPLTGQGDAQIFRDGVMIQGRWQRRSEQEFFQFVDGSGNTIALKPGTTWFEIVPIGYQLDLK